MIQFASSILARWSTLLCLGVFLFGCDSTGRQPDESPSAPQQPRYGVLSFRVSHSLDDASCFEDGSCFIEINQEKDVEQWMSRVCLRQSRTWTF